MPDKREYLFKLVPNPDCKEKSGCVPTDGWIEVLAIVPERFSIPGASVKDLSGKPFKSCDLHNNCIVRTPDGLMRIGYDDLWHAIEEYGEYILEE